MSVSPQLFSIIGVIVVLGTANALMLSQGWRLSLILLAGQYVGVFLLVAANWPIEQAIVKLITGWIATAVIGIVFVSSGVSISSDRIWPAGLIFRLLFIFLVGITVWSMAPALASWIPGASREVLFAGLLLMISGIFQFSMGSDPFYIMVGLLTFLSGFEIIYASVESSILITGLMAGVTLLLALIGAYLLALPNLEQSA